MGTGWLTEKKNHTNKNQYCWKKKREKNACFLASFSRRQKEKTERKKKNYKQHRKDHLKELLRERNLSYKELEKPQPACLKCWQSHVVPGSEVASGRRTRLLVWPTELAGHLKLEWDTKTSRCWGDPFVLDWGAGDWPRLGWLQEQLGQTELFNPGKTWKMDDFFLRENWVAKKRSRLYKKN